MYVRLITIVALSWFAILWSPGYAADPPAPKGFLLMGTLSEWIYPGAKFHGAESSDAAVTGISSVKSKAALTTPDPIEKVLAFYLQKLNVDAQGKILGEKPSERLTTHRAVSVQDNSAGRPLKLYIITINEVRTPKEPGNTTTLVVSRAADEATTHITWSDFRELAP